MEVEGDRQEIQQIQPAAKKNVKYFDKYCMCMMDTHMRLRCKKRFLVVNKTKTTGECFMRKYYLISISCLIQCETCRFFVINGEIY